MLKKVLDYNFQVQEHFLFLYDHILDLFFFLNERDFLLLFFSIVLVLLKMNRLDCKVCHNMGNVLFEIREDVLCILINQIFLGFGMELFMLELIFSFFFGYLLCKVSLRMRVLKEIVFLFFLCRTFCYFFLIFFLFLLYKN